jgi:siderophore synthetase component
VTVSPFDATTLHPPTSIGPPDADLMAAHTLLSVLVREVAGPMDQTGVTGDHLAVRLPHTGRLLRVRLRRVSPMEVHRFTAPVELEEDGAWEPVHTERLAALVGAELTLHTGSRNEEFVAQVTGSRDTLADILLTRPARPQRPVGGVAGDYLDSEQALVNGHPRHPAPKWRQGDPGQWRRYAPETRTAFPVRWLSVPAEHVREHALDGGFDAHARTAALLDGHPTLLDTDRLAVPVHPWQYGLLQADPDIGPVLRAALSADLLRDLGEVGMACHPTASVRTLYQPELDRFLKTSLNVRITNCIRKNAAYELAGAVALTRLLAEPCAEVGARHPGFAVLAEPAARSVELPPTLGDHPSRHALLEGLGTIVRAGLHGHVRPGDRVHLIGTLAAEHPDPAGTGTRLADLAARAGSTDAAGWARRWWRRYLTLLVPPVLRLWAVHGVVLEPHPQNVLVVVGPDQMPVRVLARDLEGTKLIGNRHVAALAELPADVALSTCYDEARAWNRIAYCLFVNNLTEVAGALADLASGVDRFEHQLWDSVSEVVAGVDDELDHPPRLRALLAGMPLPAKTNLLVRWGREADRHAGYVPSPNPIGHPVAGVRR